MTNKGSSILCATITKPILIARDKSQNKDKDRERRSHEDGEDGGEHSHTCECEEEVPVNTIFSHHVLIVGY